MYNEINIKEAKRILDSEHVKLIDVRTEEEYILGHIPNAILIPLDELKDRLDELPDREEKILVYCKSGRRSAMACQILLEEGYTKLYNIGGVVEWSYGLEM